ncbi:MAG: RNA polymerase sigma-70 factor, ECF subfamily [Bacteroidetes bacterium]|nr:MAG: RNA polymerase sigma-70 factor, ECF subfamily [Bacteroidota bacterium]
MTENELIAGCVKQDRNCQKLLYEQFYGKMLGVCIRYARDREEARDMLHEGFIKVYSSIRSFAGKGSFEGWVRRIMVNTSVDHLRRNKHQYLIVSTVRADEQPEQVDEVDEDDMLDVIGKEEIMAAVQQLSPAYRTVFNLYVIEEYAHKEIADMLNISEGTSKSNLAKARFQLKKNLTKLMHDNDGKRTATR